MTLRHPRPRHLNHATGLLAVALLLSACTGDPSMMTGESSPTQMTTAPAPTMQAGPIAITPEDYWTAPVTDGEVTTVRVGGCSDQAACPAFTVLAPGVAPSDPLTAVVDDGVACPGGQTPSSATLTTHTPSTLAHGEATLAVFDVVCAGTDNSETTLTQRQWHAEGPMGPIVVVDRWMLDGLPRALAEASWAEVA